jgi:hypothetical protein
MIGRVKLNRSTRYIHVITSRPDARVRLRPIAREDIRRDRERVIPRVAADAIDVSIMVHPYEAVQYSVFRL